MDVSGLLEKEIFSLAGDFEDSGESLHFGSGKIHVHLDDDSCKNKAYFLIHDVKASLYYPTKYKLGTFPQRALSSKKKPAYSRSS